MKIADLGEWRVDKTRKIPSFPTRLRHNDWHNQQWLEYPLINHQPLSS